MHLSKQNINSFAGDVVSLRLLDQNEPIKAQWSADNDTVLIREFDCGIVVALCKAGTATVYAHCEEGDFACPVTVHEMHHDEPAADMQYFIGDFHVHSSDNHNHDGSFTARTTGLPEELVQVLAREGFLDFTVISDHGVLLTDKDFYRGFIAADEFPHEGLIVLPGSESEVSHVVDDRYGIPHKNSGEIVTVNTPGYAFCTEFDEYLAKTGGSPAGIAALAHPQVVGYSVAGVWNFDLAHNKSKAMRDLVRMVEMGNGTDRSETPLFEHTLSVALDNGYTVSTSSGSDFHGPGWSGHHCPGKTILMAHTKSKEAFVDALHSCRCYACETGNIRVFYTVNGTPAPGRIPVADTYAFHIETSHLDGTPAPELVSVEIITDEEKRAAEARGIGLSSVDLQIASPQSHYFYLRFVDAEGHKTWSPPLWTELPFSDEPDDPVRCDRTGAKVCDLVTGRDASVLLNGDPRQPWFGSQIAELEITLPRETTLRGFGVVPRLFGAFSELPPRDKMTEMLMQYPCKASLAYSLDGKQYTTLKEGYLRICGGENVWRFAPVKAAYLRLSITQTMGKASCLKRFADSTLSLGELEWYE